MQSIWCLTSLKVVISAFLSCQMKGIWRADVCKHAGFLFRPLRSSFRICWCAWCAFTLSTTSRSVSASGCSGKHTATHSAITQNERVIWTSLLSSSGVSRVHEINSLLAPFDYTTQPSWQNPKYLGEWQRWDATTYIYSSTVPNCLGVVDLTGGSI